MPIARHELARQSQNELLQRPASIVLQTCNCIGPRCPSRKQSRAPEPRSLACSLLWRNCNARIFGAELLGTVSVIPYAVRALTLHRSLPDARTRGASDRSVSLLRGVRYGAAERNVMDVYLPPSTQLPLGGGALGRDAASSSSSSSSGAGTNGSTSGGGAVPTASPEASPAQPPVVLFVHGGVWVRSGGELHLRT